MRFVSLFLANEQIAQMDKLVQNILLKTQEEGGRRRRPKKSPLKCPWKDGSTDSAHPEDRRSSAGRRGRDELRVPPGQPLIIYRL
jgi:hypothetical protein